MAQRSKTGVTSWEYQGSSSNKWILFENGVQEFLSKNFKGTSSSVMFNEKGCKLEFDCSEMRVRNEVNGLQRTFRFIILDQGSGEGGIVWEFQTPKRRWQSFSPDAATLIEKSYTKYMKDQKKNEIVTVTSGTNTYDVNFKENKMVHSSAGRQTSVRRVISNPLLPADDQVFIVPASDSSSTTVLRSRRANTVAEVEVEKLALPKSKVKKATGAKNGEDAVKSENNGNSGEVAGQNSSKSKRGKTANEVDAAVNGRAKRKNNVDEAKQSSGKKKKLKLSEIEDEEEDLGNALVDIECVQMLGKAQVYSENGNVYDAMLNQTNIQNNNNKYFLLQLLVSKAKKAYSVWFRWGRVGFRGQSSLTECGNDVEKAKRIFEQKFRDKTGNCFSDRKNFVKHAGKYDLIKISYNDNKKAKQDVAKKREEKENVPAVESKLEPRIKHIMELICDVKSMERDLRNMEYDVNKCPLGSISKAQVKEGFKALTRIQEHVQTGKFNSDFVNAMNDYYTRIPHCFGMRVPPEIRTLDHLKREITLLETMSEIELAMTSIKEELKNLHPLDNQYNCLRYNFKPLEKECSTAKIIDQYLNTTRGTTHSLKMKLKGVFELEYRDASYSSLFRGDIGNRKLLWHGSRMTNWFGILSQGLRIAPPEAPSTGYMFGKGVYFADASSKSANYSMAQQGQSIFMVLSEVALGETNELKQSDPDAHLLPPGKHSVRGAGRYIPDPSKTTSLDDGLVVPMGPLIENDADGLSLIYNEYIVYDTNQIRERFLVEIDASFDFTL